MHLYLAEHALTDLNDGESFFYRRGDDVLGVVTLKIHEHPMFGCWVNEVFIALRPLQNEIAAWLEAVLAQLSLDENYPIVSRISGYHQHLLPVLHRHGLGVDAVGLVSDTKQALDQLVQHYDPPIHFESEGLSHTLMCPEDFDEVIALREAAFRRAPQFCWFGANVGHLEMLALEACITP